MEAIDITRVTYELIRQHDDRLLMRWEDDRGHLLREITTLKKKIKKDEKTSRLLKDEINRLYDSFQSILNNENQKVNSSKRKSLSISDNDLEVESLPKPSTKKTFLEIPHDLDQRKIPSTTRSLTAIPQRSRRQNSVGSSSTSIRSKSERELMDGHECEECKRYYRIMEQQGLIISSTSHECGLTETLRRCSRHKSPWNPPSTPDGFWDLTVHTPEDWKKKI